MEKLKRLEVKKLLKELDFIQSDFDYKNEMISQADTDFINSVNQFLLDYPELKKIYDKKISDKLDEVIQKKIENIKSEKIEEVEEDKEISHKTKKLYREIAKISHPDKIQDTKVNELYIQASKFHKDDNIIGILSICNELDIEYELDEEDIDIISETLERVKSKIVFLESTITWKWLNNKNTDVKKQMILQYIQNKIK